MPAGLLDAEAFSPLGEKPVQVHIAEDLTHYPHAIHVFADRSGAVPPLDPAPYDVLMTTAPDPPAPWVAVEPARFEAQINRIQTNVHAAPHAAAVLARVLRINQRLRFDEALIMESLAYSAVQGGAAHRNWIAARRPSPPPTAAADPVHYERDDAHVTLTLDSPATRNAMTAQMRDALYTALANVLEDPSRPSVLLCGAGRCFSTGGALAEFGTTNDPAEAHTIRTLRSAAVLLHRLGDRAAVHLHGACIGSGIEIAMAADRRTAATDLMIQLPELALGLIPGAGGTVTLPRVIGRHRMAWLALGGFRIGARQALDWGLVHEVVP